MVQGMGNTNEQRGVTGSMKHGSKHVTYAHVIQLLNISPLIIIVMYNNGCYELTPLSYSHTHTTIFNIYSLSEALHSFVDTLYNAPFILIQSVHD